MAASLTLSGIGKTFPLSGGGEIEAITDLSFDVAENEICVILGPSGCGKSTVLRMIAGLETPTTGTLMLGEREINGTDRDRGIVFQAYTSFDWLSVRGNVEYGMRINGIPKKERRERG